MTIDERMAGLKAELDKWRELRQKAHADEAKSRSAELQKKWERTMYKSWDQRVAEAEDRDWPEARIEQLEKRIKKARQILEPIVNDKSQWGANQSIVDHFKKKLKPVLDALEGK